MEAYWFALMPVLAAEIRWRLTQALRTAVATPDAAAARPAAAIRASLLLDVAAGITIPSLVAGMLEPFATD